MRLGDASNFSYGRTSASTLDDSFSGRAELASSDTSDGDSEDGSDVSENFNVKNESDRDLSGPPLKKQRQYTEDSPLAPNNKYSPADATYGGAYNVENMGKVSTKAKKPRPTGLSIKTSKPLKSTKKPKSGSISGTHKHPLSPSSMASASRKSSASGFNFQHQLGADEEDLSSKPRCQRCRKSKKGCNRERPCQRCKDAGIGIEGCISEDEGNGRKGRYGRHMGVPIKRSSDALGPDSESEQAGAILTDMGTDQFGGLNKKRKR